MQTLVINQNTILISCLLSLHKIKNNSFFFNFFLSILDIYISSPEEYYLVKDTKRVGKLELCILFNNIHILFRILSIRQYNRLLKSKKELRLAD